jgi:hypothetical protein
LAIDEEDLERKLRDMPGVVFLIHYFGFARSPIERVADMCRCRGSVLIEDCGHALFSEFRGRELGDLAPIAIFSLQKILPIPDGGALKLNSESLQRVTEKPFQPPQLGKFSFETFFGYPKSAARASLGPRIAGVYRCLRSHGAEKQQALTSEFSTDATVYPWNVDAVQAGCRQRRARTDIGSTTAQLSRIRQSPYWEFRVSEGIR